MTETLIAIALLIFIPMAIHYWITSAYYDQTKTFFGNDRIEDAEEEHDLDNATSEETKHVD